MAGVAAEVADGNILGLVERFLKAGVMEEGKFRPTTVGTPQGGVITPPTMLRTRSVLQQ
jgi:RNA-directed DNA polymerase